MLESQTPIHHDGPDRDTGLSVTRAAPAPAAPAMPAARRRKALIAVPVGLLALTLLITQLVLDPVFLRLDLLEKHLRLTIT